MTVQDLGNFQEQVSTFHIKYNRLVDRELEVRYILQTLATICITATLLMIFNFSYLLDL